MKILKIRFKNIHNLKGENEISFENEPLKSAGIFAITGPTGSGKSSLLDVITLALFNKIPRFKGSISKSTIENLGSVITHHTNEAMASITYSINDAVFTSTWNVDPISKGKNKGKAGDYSMFIYNSSGVPITQNRSEVPQKNEEIIGLKYDQFIKSILLSQGQFAKFLKADRHERGQLLENITGTSIYRKISIAAFEKYKAVRNEVDLEKDRLENIQILPEEERNELISSIEAHDKQKVALDKTLEGYQLAKTVKTEIEKAERGINQKEIELQQLNTQQSQFKEQLEQLDRYEKLSPILGKLTQYKDAVSNRLKEIEELNKQQTQMQQLTQSKQQTLDAIEQLTGKSVSEENYAKVIGAFETEVNALVQEMSFVETSGRNVRERINAKLQNSDVALIQRGKPNQALKELKTILEGINTNLSNAGIDDSGTIEEVEQSYDQLSKELSQLKEILQLVREQSTFNNRKEKAQNEVKRFVEEVEKWEPLVIATGKLVAQSKQTLELQIKQKQDALLIAKLSDHRKDLKDGEPCPLCGAVHHPYGEHVPESQNHLDLAISETRKKLAEFESELLIQEKNLAKGSEGKQLMESQIKTIEEELAGLNSTLKKLGKAYSGHIQLDFTKLDQQTSELDQKVQLMNSARGQMRNRTVVKDLIADYKDLEQVFEKYQTLKTKKDQMYTGESISDVCNQLQEQFREVTTQISSTEVLIDRVKSQLKNNNQIIAETESSLQKEIQSYGFSTIEDASKFVLSESVVQQLRNKKDELMRKHTSLSTELENLRTSLTENQGKDDMKDQSLESVNQYIIDASMQKESLIRTIGENTAKLKKDDEERERQNQKASTLKKLQEKLDQWSLMARLIGDASGNKFSNFAQGLTLQNLLVYANRRLLKLSDRYLLDKPLKDGPLTVVDQYQGNIQRSVTTLSGGESFLISLALALSLSDMASKNVTLESLFIDEGFGTLDQESLDVAMNTLEKLQTESQKMVGVISHVEALKERILVQIKLNKNAQGYGTIKIEG